MDKKQFDFNFGNVFRLCLELAILIADRDYEITPQIFDRIIKAAIPSLDNPQKEEEK